MAFLWANNLHAVFRSPFLVHGLSLDCCQIDFATRLCVPEFILEVQKICDQISYVRAVTVTSLHVVVACKKEVVIWKRDPVCCFYAVAHGVQHFGNSTAKMLALCFEHGNQHLNICCAVAVSRAPRRSSGLDRNECACVTFSYFINLHLFTLCPLAITTSMPCRKQSLYVILNDSRYDIWYDFFIIFCYQCLMIDFMWGGPIFGIRLPVCDCVTPSTNSSSCPRGMDIIIIYTLNRLYP